MHRKSRFTLVMMALLLMVGMLGIQPAKLVEANNISQPLPFSQDWTNPALITTSDDWSAVPGIVGFRGDGLTSADDVDPQTVLGPDSPGVIDVNANIVNPNTYTTGGVTEFAIDNPVVALQGSGTADAPYLLMYLNSTGFQDIVVSYLLRDIDGSPDNSAQQVALHYRVGGAGDFINVPTAYIADASDGPSLTKETPVSVTLPANANNQATLQLRIMTTNADGSDEWIGIDNISITGSPLAEDLAPAVASTIPINGGTAQKTDDIVITFSEPVTVVDPWFSISCGTSGSHTAVVTDADPTFTLNPDADFEVGETCTVTIIAANVVDDDTDDATYNAMLENYTFSFTAITPPEGCGDDYTPIYEIQGSGETSPLAGTALATEGVVVGDFQTGGKNGYYIQDVTGDGNPATSDGIFVYNTTTAVSVGDHVRVRGTAVEYFGITEISPVTQVWICSTGNTVAPTEVTLPVTAVTDFEKYESMLVTFPQSLIISEYFNFDRYGEIVLTSERHMTPTAFVEPGAPAQAAAQAYLLDRITLDDGRTAQNPDPAIHPNGLTFTMENLFRGGGTVTGVTGVLDYSYNLYRVQPTMGATYADANPRTATPSITEGDLKVASFNVLNYFVTLDDDVNDICGPSGTLECRGADTAEEFGRQRAKILAALDAIDADIYGLMEIENEHPGGGDAVADLVAGLNAIEGVGPYDYIETGAIGTDAIKQAILYKPAAVTPVGEYQILDSSVDDRFIDTLNRPVLAQVFRDNATGDEFVVAVNHLKSKGSACEGDPDTGDGQGNCNLTRLAAAQALVDWLANPDYFPDVEKTLIFGDLNSYDKEDPIDAIKLGADDTANTADDYLDMIFEKRGESAYGYVFDGQTGYLDHALANHAMAEAIVDVNFWHINADEPDLIDYDMSFKLPAQDALYASDAYRSSDHDPVIITLDMNAAPVAQNQAVTTAEDTSIEITLTATDLEGDTLTYEIVAQPAHGSVTLADNVATYNPAANFHGTDTFTFKANDGTADSNIATVTITVTAVNDAPVAVADAYTMNEDEVLTVAEEDGILANDNDVEGDTLTAILVANVSHGTLALAEDGSFVYTPAENFFGTDSFTYKANDGLADSNIATVTITVTDVKDQVVAVDDEYETDEDATLTIAAPGVLANDIDVDNNLWTAALVTDVQHGSLSLLGDGSFTYIPDPDFFGTDTFVYRLVTYPAPQDLWTDEATVTITVTPVNDAPVAVDDEYTVAEKDTLTISAPGVLTNDLDVDGDTLTAILVDTVSNGTLTLNADGSFTYTPNAYFNGTDSFTYKAKDAVLESDLAVVTITVAPVNDWPIANDDFYEVLTGTELVKDAAEGVLANDVLLDPDEEVSVQILEGPQHGDLSMNDDGSFTYIPDAGYMGTDTFRYMVLSVQINAEWSDDATVTITVQPLMRLFLPLVLR